MNKRFGAIATLVAAVAAAAGLFASPSNSASSECPKGRPGIPGCLVSLTATGPSPSTVRMAASWKLEFRNTDSRTHTIRAGARLSLHGQVARSDRGSGLNVTLPVLVVVLARHSKQPFEPVATVRARFQGSLTNASHYHAYYRWKLNVQPDVTTTYLAKVTSQRWCVRPASLCAHPQGQLWTNPKSRPFTVRIRK